MNTPSSGSEQLFPGSVFVRPHGQQGPHDVHTIIRGQLIVNPNKSWHIIGKALLVRAKAPANEGFLGYQNCLVKYNPEPAELVIDFVGQPLTITGDNFASKVTLINDSSFVGFQLEKTLTLDNGQREMVEGSRVIARKP